MTAVAKIVRTPDRSENIDLFCLQNMIQCHNVAETCRAQHTPDEVSRTAFMAIFCSD